jgi:hypothetical protein
VVAILGTSPTFAQDAPKGDPSQGTGPVPPNVAPNPTPICTDRPTKANVACTVPAGDVQIESDIVNWSRITSDGMQQDTILYTDPVLKYGLTKHADVEISIAPYETVRTRMSDGATDTVGGVGDLYLRLKQKLTPDGAKTQISIIPYLKAPTAKSGIGNGKWEGGIIVPVNVPLPADFTMTLGPEIDILADDSGPGYHATLVSLVNISHPVGKKINLYAEFWNSQSLERQRTVHEYSTDLAASYQLARSLQMDIGIDFGLNRDTPSRQAYLGISTRF